MEKQDNDTMFSWDGASLFDTEESTLRTECTPTATKDMDLTISKIKRQAYTNDKDKIPGATTLNQEEELSNETVKPMEDVEEGSSETSKEFKMEIPTENQPVEEKDKSTGERKTSTPLFLLTLEILNHKVHNCLVDSESSVNVMPFAICKKT